MSESSLTKLQALRTVTLLKRDSNTGFLLWILWIIQEHLFCRWLWRAGTETPVRLFKNTFFYRASPVAASDDSFRFPASNFTKKRLQKRRYSVNFPKFLRTSFVRHLRMTASCFYLWILRSFPDHLFYRAPLENCLFHLQVAEFQPPHTVNKYFTCAFLAFYTRRRRRSSYSKEFMYLKSLKIICEEVNL